MKNSKQAKQSRRSLHKLLIAPFKQVRFGLYILLITVSFLFLTGLILINSFLEQYQHVLGIFNVVDPHLRWELIADDIFYTNLTRLIVCLGIFVLVIFSTVIRLTHRFYGPILSINRFAEDLKRGNYSARIKLRRRDELQDVAKKLNELAEILEKKKSH